jgi:hypothetical protein
MLTYYGIDIVMEEPDEKLFSYMDSFFDFNTLVSYIKLTYKGAQKYGNDKRGIIESVLNCTKFSKDYLKYERFELKCEEWDIYFDETFIGFTKEDINKSIAYIVARDLEELKLTGKI